MKPVRVVNRRSNALLLLLLVVVGTVALVFLYSLWTNHVYSQEINQLNSKAADLYLDIEQQKTEIANLKSLFDDSNMTSNISVLNTGNEAKGNSTLLEKLTAAFDDKITQTKLDLQSKLDSVKSYAANTYQGLNNLGEQFQKHIEKPLVVDLADQCSAQVEHCTVPSSSSQGKYWKSCRTSRVELSIPVRLTVIQIKMY